MKVKETVDVERITSVVVDVIGDPMHFIGIWTATGFTGVSPP